MQNLQAQICISVLAIGLLVACSRDNTDLEFEQEVKRKGLEVLRMAAAPKAEIEIGKLFGAKSSVFCVTGTIPQELGSIHSLRPEFRKLLPALQRYVEQNPGDPSLESRRVFFVSDVGVEWSAEILPGVYNLHFDGRPDGCYRLTDTVFIENSNPSGPLVVTLPASKDALNRGAPAPR